MLVSTATFFEPVGRHLARELLLVGPDATCASVVERLSQVKVPGAYVVDAEHRLIGIVTTGDIARRVTFRLARDEPVRHAMTSPALALRDDEPLYRALARMRRHGWRHMPVVDGAGRVAGIFSSDAALEQPMAFLERAVGDESVAGLSQVKAAQPELAAALLVGEHSVAEIQTLFSEINLDIHRRVVALALEAMAGDGWGAPPVPFSVIVMGSIGRGESLLAPDQDNGFILDDHPASDGVVVQRFFAELALRFTTALAQVGFAPCHGEVMASNPMWRKPLREWKQQIASWIAERSGHAILEADIWLDFRAAGPPDPLAESLRAHALNAVARHRLFLREMCLALMDTRVGLGLFGGLATEPAGDRHHLNLKLRGLLPLVGAVRLLALRAGLAETSTLARIARLIERGALRRDEGEALVDAYRDLIHRLLRQQLADHAAGRPVGNLVSLAGSSRAARRRLTDSLGAVDGLQRRVIEDFTSEIL